MKKYSAKLIIAILISTILLAFAGCASQPDDPVINTETNQEIPPEYQGKTKLTLGTYFCSPTLKTAIDRFNKSNPDYYVEVISDENADYYDYMDKRSVKIMTGRAEDILVLTEDYRVPAYIKNGALENLTAYMERDINMDDYLEGALCACSVETETYAICSEFWYNLVIGDASSMGGSGNISLTNLAEYAANAKTKTLLGREPLDTLWFLYQYFQFDLTDQKELENAILLAEEYGKIPTPETTDNGDSMIQLGTDSYFFELGIYSPDALINIELAYGTVGEQIVFLTPTDSAALLSGNVYGINARSSNKDGAWEFLMFLLSENEQEEHTKNFPVYKDAYTRLLEEKYDILCKEYESREQDLNDHIDMEKYSDLIENLLENSKIYYGAIDYDAWNIVKEEARFYYDGEKSLDEVMNIIQNRISTYLNESQN